MLLNTYFDAIELHRNDKFVALRFRAPHRVISTSLDNGGVANDLDLVYNHQGCEPAGPLSRHPSRAVIDRPDLYTAALLERHVHDQLAWGTAPAPCRREAAADHGAQIAVAASGRRDRWNYFHDTLAERCATVGRDDPAFVVPLALGIGYTEKWEQQHAMLAGLDAKIASHDLQP